MKYLKPILIFIVVMGFIVGISELIGIIFETSEENARRAEIKQTLHDDIVTTKCVLDHYCIIKVNDFYSCYYKWGHHAFQIDCKLFHEIQMELMKRGKAAHHSYGEYRRR